MEHLNNLTLFFLLFFLVSLPTEAVKLAECRGGVTFDQYIDCPDCKAYQAEDVTPLADGVEDTLWKCKGKPLNIAECAHQCQCSDDDKGILTCRAWEGCSSTTVTNFCKCVWEGDNNGGQCKPGTENKLWQDGGRCFCAGRCQHGSPPHDC